MAEQIDFKKKQALDILKSQYEMMENTIYETERKLQDQLLENGKKMYTKEQIDDRLSSLREVQKDTIKQYIETGGNPDELTVKKKGSKGGKRSNRTYAEDKTAMVSKKVEKVEKVENIKEKNTKMSYIPKKRDYSNSVAFDVIPLPSNGEPYRHKSNRLQVAYLTANDENMFVSPNLYRDGLLIDFLLSEKVLDSGIDCGELLDGDRDAIILWLRATGYGNEFPITATDNVTGTEFETVIDLSQIKFKEFKLIGDEKGWFDFVLPMTKDEIKFKFLNHREIEELKKKEVTETPASVKNRLNTIAEDLRKILDDDESMNKIQKSKLYDACRTIEDWSEDIEEDSSYYSNIITNRFEMQVMSVNGNTNRSFITEYVRNMNTRDSLALRKYISENEPGLDFNIEVEKPKSLGGGSQKVFLSVDQFIFLNIA